MNHRQNKHPFTHGYEFTADIPGLGTVDVVAWGSNYVVFSERERRNPSTPEIMINNIPIAFRADLLKYRDDEYNPSGRVWKVAYLSVKRMDKPFADATASQREKVFDALQAWIDGFEATNAGKVAMLRGYIAKYRSEAHHAACKADDAEQALHDAEQALYIARRQAQEYEELLREHYFPMDEILASDPGEPND